MISISLLVILLEIDFVEAQPTETSESIVTIEPISDITSNLSPYELKDRLVTNFLISRSIINNENEPLRMGISEGILSCARAVCSTHLNLLLITDSS
jgi:hypothetical protein